MNKEEIRQFKALLRQGILRHRSVLLDAKFQSELLNIIKGYEHLEQQCKKQQEVIDKATDYIKERFYFNEETGEYSLLHTFDKCNIKELLDILKEASECNK